MTVIDDVEEIEVTTDIDQVTASAPRPARRARGPIHRFMTARRRPIVKVHRWLSFILMLWIVVESVTGAGIVFSGEIDRVWNASQFTSSVSSTGVDVGMPAAISAARERRPQELVRYVTAPGGEDGGGVYWVWMTDRTGDYHAVLVDPGSGTINSADHHAPKVIEWMQAVHENLNSTSIFGFEPVKVLGWLAVGWLVVLLAGISVWWWPGIKRWATALRVRRRRGKFTFHLDLHKAVGIAMFLPLLVLTITGINFAFPNQVRDAWNVVTFGNYEDPDATAALSTRAAGASSINAGQAIEAVHAVDPSVVVQYVTGPGGSPVGVWTVEALVDPSFFGTVGGQREIELSVDQYSGAVIAIEDPADKSVASAAYDDWSSDTHFGTVGGTTTKVLWVLVGLSPLVLSITGTRLWFIRRAKRRRRSNDTSATTPTATSIDPLSTTDEPALGAQP